MAEVALKSIEDILFRIDDLLRVVDEVAGPDLHESEAEAEIVEAARKALKAEQERSQLFGSEMFPNPGWAILLHLFVASAEGRDSDIAGACAAAGVPETVALRHLAVLVSAKLVSRQAHNGGAGRSSLTLTQAGKKRLFDYFSRAPGEWDAAAA